MPPVRLHQRLKGKLLLMAGDAVIIALITVWQVADKISDYPDLLGGYAKVGVILLLLLSLYLVSNYLFGLYDEEAVGNAEKALLFTVLSSIVVFVLFSSLSYFIISLRPGKVNLLATVGLCAVLLLAWRFLYVRLFRPAPRRLLLIGNDQLIGEIKEEIQRHGAGSYEVLGHWHRYSHNPTLPDLAGVVRDQKVDQVVYSVHSRILDRVSSSLINLQMAQRQITNAYTFYQQLTGKFPIRHVDDFWMLVNSRREILFPRLRAKVKRVFDFLFACLLLPTALPVLALAAIAIKVESKGPVLFIQERLGLFEKPFRLCKLRTMVDNAEALSGPTWSSERDPRITRVGKWLRKLRLDELPQIFNVLKGEMSIIGPRPIRQHFADLLASDISYYRLRFLTKPGLTGWAQVNHDYAGSVAGQAEKVQYDLFYIINQSFFLDVFILIKTCRVMLWGKGT
ncbi:MAG: sugar transferase [Deltaproteobacteria bacterium]|nr:sugar transferase [Deltaproteobacteria bacterium]MBM4287012.1 sugar transferase [Deltaproteobacteria bacterium]